MSETIFLLDDNGALTELSETGYISEDMLQDLLARYPNLISGSQIGSAGSKRWLLISREVGIPDDTAAGNRWSLDHLFIDQDGIPTLVEVKRSTDTRIRREVVGQILDYAANAVTYWTIEEIQYRFEKQCALNSTDQEQAVMDFLQNEMDVEVFWETVRTNLKAGKIRMLIAADTIPRELQRIIEFLNEQMAPAEILGLEIKQFTGQNNLKTLVPRVIGRTAGAESTKSVSKGKSSHWNEATFFQELTKLRGEGEAIIARQILSWLTSQISRVWYGTGDKRGSMVPILSHKSYEHQLFALWTDGAIEIYFQWYKGKPPFHDEEKRIELLSRLNQITGVNISREKITARPSFPIRLLADKVEYQKFADTFQWFIEEVRR